MTITPPVIEYTGVSKNKVIYLALSAAVSIVLIWLLFSQVETQDVLTTLSRLSLPALGAYIIAALFGAWIRAWRYKLLLRPETIGWGNILMTTFIRNSLIDLLPARIGSLSFIYVLNKRFAFPFEAAASTFILAFVFDFLTLGPFLITAVLAIGLKTDVISGRTLLPISMVFLLAVSLVLWKIIPLGRAFLAFYRRALDRLGAGEKKFSRLSIAKLELTIQSLSPIKEQRLFFPVLGLSFLTRLAKYISIYCLFFGLLENHGHAVRDLNFWVFLLGLSGAELSSALPIKGLAGFGTWESAWALTFRLMNFDVRLAVLSGIGVHLITNVFEYTLGIASLLILAGPYFRKRRGADDRL